MLQDAELILIRKAKEADQQAFPMLVEFHQAFAYTLAHRFTGHEEDAEDVVQKAFVKVWNNLDRYNPEFRFKTWLGKIVTNLCLDYLKSGKRKTESRKNEASDRLSMADPVQHDRELEAEELKNIIMQLAQQFTEKQRAVFVLHDLEMQTTGEVCAMLNMASGNLKSNLYFRPLNRFKLISSDDYFTKEDNAFLDRLPAEGKKSLT
jgi:RNA polymerase sigma-70 factor (ECF subfamily)